jgi:hypothetical protein
MKDKNKKKLKKSGSGSIESELDKLLKSIEKSANSEDKFPPTY